MTDAERTITFDERSFTGNLNGLDFTMQLPVDWVSEPVSSKEIDFDNPIVMAPLAEVRDANSTVTLRINTRPAFETDTLSGWARYLMDNASFTVHSLEAQDIGSYKGVAGRVTDALTFDKFLTRFAFLEDDNRIVQLIMATTSKHPDTHLTVWTAALESFALLDARGSKAAVFPPVVDWWGQAKKLEANNQLDEAEAVLKNAIPHLGFASQTAQLYAERYTRLLQAHDIDGAANAHKKAVEWMYTYAGFATSGGEGAALSWERDAFIKALGPSPRA